MLKKQRKFNEILKIILKNARYPLYLAIYRIVLSFKIHKKNQYYSIH